MLVLAVSVLGVVALGPLAVLSSSYGFNLSTVEQCGPVNISFFGIASPSDAVPVTLTLLPFDSQPISIPISNFARSSTGVALSFLPLAADTSFVASFDDAAGNSILRVTDVIGVLPSPTGNSTCLPPASDVTSRRFALNGSLSQCQPFDVTYDPMVMAQPPSVRLFTPRGVAVSVNRTGQFVNGTATYTMCAQRGKQVVLEFDDGQNYRETTSLITVGGDSTSDKSCICTKDASGGDGGSSETILSGSGSSAKLSKGAIIGISAGGGFVGIMAVLMVLYVLRERRRRRSRGVALGDGPFGKETGNEKFGSSISSNFPMYSRSSWDQKSSPFSPTPPVPPPKSPRYMNPPSLFSPASPDYPRNSLSSFDPVTPNDQLDQTFQNNVGSPEATGRGFGRSDRPSISSADIKTLLDVATMHMDGNGGRILTPPSVPLGSHLSEDLVLPTATTRRWPHPARGNLRDPSHSRSLSESFSDSSSIISVLQPSRPLRVAKRVRPNNGKISTFPTFPTRLNTAQTSSGWFEEF